MIRIEPRNDQDISDLRILANKYKIHYWNNPGLNLQPVLTLVRNNTEFLQQLTDKNISYVQLSDNFQRVIDSEDMENETTPDLQRSHENFDYNTIYHRYESIGNQIRLLAKIDSRVTYKSYGKSAEGRHLMSVHITDNSNNGGNRTKKVVIFECGIHAREWIAPATCLWIINHLTTDPLDQTLLKKFEFIIAPLVNPDGYVYTYTTNRMWLKNRSLQRNGEFGVDLNRNFDVNFGGMGSNKDPFSEAYCGPEPFSEPETRYLAQLILSHYGRIAAYFAFHSFSQLWLSPYAYKVDKPFNYRALQKLSRRAIQSIETATGAKYTMRSFCYEADGVSPGTSVDFVFDAAKVKVAFTLELKDTGHYGFMLPARNIRHAAYEVWVGIRAALYVMYHVKFHESLY